MPSKFSLATTAGVVAAGLTYFFDPVSGNRRRAMARDKAGRYARQAERAAELVARDFRQRSMGLACEVKAALRREDPGDEIMVNRVAARLGHVASRPSTITIAAEHGKVTLGGEAPAHEITAVVRAAAGVHGVVSVESRMRPVSGAEASSQRKPRVASWPLPMRLAGLGAGTGMVVASLGAGNARMPRTLLGLIGLGLVARSIASVPLSRLGSVQALRNSVQSRRPAAIPQAPSPAARGREIEGEEARMAEEHERPSEGMLH